MFVRLSADEFDAVAAAAARVGLTPSGYAGEAAVASACAVVGVDGVVEASVTRNELAQVQRELFAGRTAVVAAAAGLSGVTGRDAGREVALCAAAVDRLDELVAWLHGLLKKTAS